MKKMFLIPLLLFVFAFPLSAQTITQTIAYTDTIGNSQTRIFDIPVDQNADSLRIGLYCYGEIDIDSLDVKLGYVGQTKYKGNTVSVDYFTSTNATYSKTLTVDLNNTTDSYTVKVVAIPNSALLGYNYLRLFIKSGASGNTPSGTKQKFVIITSEFKT